MILTELIEYQYNPKGPDRFVYATFPKGTKRDIEGQSVVWSQEPVEVSVESRGD